METWTDKETGLAIEIEICKPFDAHEHLRRMAMLRLVLPMVAKRFCGAVIMPNTKPPITSGHMVSDYLDEIRDSLPEGSNFKPLMTMYMTDTLDPTEVISLMQCQEVCGLKYYPRGLTTNSETGVDDPAALWSPSSGLYEILRAMPKVGGILFLHAADGLDKDRNELDPYDQEKHFIRETLPRIIDAHPYLKISVEHLSTLEGVEFMQKNGGPRLGCSLTAQHLLLDRRDVFHKGFRPHRFWWPIIQPREHKEALREFAKEGRTFVWLGSDSAPHPVASKENDCCMGGVLMAHAGIELYVEAFEDIGALSKLEDFASRNFLRFCGIEPSIETITLVRDEWKVESPFYCVSEDDENGATVVPFRLGEKVRWKLL